MGLSWTHALGDLVREDEGGATRAIDDARGKNTEDAAMPGGMVEDDGFGGELRVLGENGGKPLLDIAEGFAFGLTAGSVEVIELVG